MPSEVPGCSSGSCRGAVRRGRPCTGGLWSGVRLPRQRGRELACVSRLVLSLLASRLSLPTVDGSVPDGRQGTGWCCRSLGHAELSPRHSAREGLSATGRAADAGETARSAAPPHCSSPAPPASRVSQDPGPSIAGFPVPAAHCAAVSSSARLSHRCAFPAAAGPAPAPVPTRVSARPRSASVFPSPASLDPDVFTEF